MRKSFFFNQRNESLNYQIAFFTYFFDKYIFFLLKMFYWVNAVKYVHVPHTAGFFVTYFLIHETTPRSGYKTFTDPPEASVVPFLVNNPPHKNSHHSDFYLHSLVGLFLNLIKKKKMEFYRMYLLCICLVLLNKIPCSCNYHWSLAVFFWHLLCGAPLYGLCSPGEGHEDCSTMALMQICLPWTFSCTSFESMCVYFSWIQTSEWMAWVTDLA